MLWSIGALPRIHHGGALKYENTRLSKVAYTIDHDVLANEFPSVKLSGPSVFGSALLFPSIV